MRDAVAVAATSVPSDRHWFGLTWKSIAWGVLLGSIIYYVRRDALHYLFHYTPDSFKAFWSERILIRTHIACAVTMISTGTLQFWTGLRMRNMTFHVWCGRVFLASGTFVGCSALYMGLHPRLGGIVYGFGLFLNGLFWLAAAFIAYYAIRLGNVQVHKDWMIRTYVLACAGIVGDRIIPDMTFVARRIGDAALLDISGWANWAVPLMVVEVVMQIRRLRKICHPVRAKSTT
jgi:Predicted membrane protein